MENNNIMLVRRKRLFYPKWRRLADEVEILRAKNDNLNLMLEQMRKELELVSKHRDDECDTDDENPDIIAGDNGQCEWRC